MNSRTLCVWRGPALEVLLGKVDVPEPRQGAQGGSLSSWSKMLPC